MQVADNSCCCYLEKVQFTSTNSPGRWTAPVVVGMSQLQFCNGTFISTT